MGDKKSGNERARITQFQAAHFVIASRAVSTAWQSPKIIFNKWNEVLYGIGGDIGIKLSFDDEAVDLIAQKAFDRKTGARGLRSILENVMMDTMYEIPSDDTIGACIITKEAVEGKEEPKIVRREVKRAKEA